MNFDNELYFLHSQGYLCTPNYKIISTLGTGTFGLVLKILDLNTNIYYAVKIIRITNQGDAQYETCQLSNISKLKFYSEYVVKYYGSFVMQMNPNVQNKNFTPVQSPIISNNDMKSYMCIFTSLHGPSLYKLLKYNAVKFTLHQMKYLTRNILKSIRFLHNNNIVHTDLKPENILLTEPLPDKTIIDKSNFFNFFHLSIRLCDLNNVQVEDNKQLQYKGIISTCSYRSPEIIAHHSWSKPIDVWALGCIIYEVYTGQRLFNWSYDFGESDDGRKAALYHMEKRLANTNYIRANIVDETMIDFLSKCLIMDQTKRWTIDQLSLHPFVDIDEQMSYSYVNAPYIERRSENLNMFSMLNKDDAKVDIPKIKQEERKYLISTDPNVPKRYTNVPQPNTDVSEQAVIDLTNLDEIKPTFVKYCNEYDRKLLAEHTAFDQFYKLDTEETTEQYFDSYNDKTPTQHIPKLEFGNINDTQK